MNITETNIPDVTTDNIPLSKRILADNIIKNVYPLFDGVYTEKLEIISRLKSQLKGSKTELQNQKESIQQTMTNYSRKKKISKLLDRIEQLVESGLVYDGTLKHETVILLKILDKLSSENLDQQVSKTIQMINKRFSK